MLKSFPIFLLTLSILSAFLIPAFAPVSAASLIPCGEDLNKDGLIKNYTQGLGGKTVVEVCDFGQMIVLVNRIIDFLIFALIIPGSVLVFMYAGFLHITSVANPGQRTKANGMFFSVLKGLGISLCAWIIVKAIVLGLGASDTTVLWLLGK